jgi:hypothetical protein
MTKVRNAYKVVVRNPAGKRQLGRPTRSWEYNIKMGVKDNRRGERGVDLTRSEWGKEPSGSRKEGNFLGS